jgi:hypothetical protein
VPRPWHGSASCALALAREHLERSSEHSKKKQKNARACGVTPDAGCRQKRGPQFRQLAPGHPVSRKHWENLRQLRRLRCSQFGTSTAVGIMAKRVGWSAWSHRRCLPAGWLPHAPRPQIIAPHSLCTLGNCPSRHLPWWLQPVRHISFLRPSKAGPFHTVGCRCRLSCKKASNNCDAALVIATHATFGGCSQFGIYTLPLAWQKPVLLTPLAASCRLSRQSLK